MEELDGGFGRKTGSISVNSDSYRLSILVNNNQYFGKLFTVG
jgi:hypothetical protein